MVAKSAVEPMTQPEINYESTLSSRQMCRTNTHLKLKVQVPVCH